MKIDVKISDSDGDERLVVGVRVGAHEKNGETKLYNFIAFLKQITDDLLDDEATKEPETDDPAGGE